MLIPFSKISLKYRLEVKGIIHVGAHLMEEKEDYSKHKIEKVIWIEGNPDLYNIKKGTVGDKQKLFNYLISDKNGEEVKFHVANNGMSSSILEFGSHSKDHPDITYIEERKMTTLTLKSVFDENGLNPAEYNFMNLDIQGVELRALKGFKEYLKNIDYIYTEVNVSQVYKGNDLMEDIDAFLSQYGFQRVETVVTPGGWGDAFYTKKRIPSKLHRTLTDFKFPEDTTGKSLFYRASRRITNIVRGYPL